jgi:hypothetical protein
VRGRELRQRGDDKVSVSKLSAVAAAADATPRSYKVRRVGIDKEHVTCVHFHHEFEIVEVPTQGRVSIIVGGGATMLRKEVPHASQPLVNSMPCLKLDCTPKPMSKRADTRVVGHSEGGEEGVEDNESQGDGGCGDDAVVSARAAAVVVVDDKDDDGKGDID